MRAALFFAATLGLILGARAQQTVYAPVDLSSYAKKSEVDAIASTVPQPAGSAPPPELPGGTVGTPGVYRPADARQPRITRSKTVTLTSDGTGTFDWSSQGAINTPVQVALAPIYVGGAIPKCWVTAVSATSASIKCVMENVTLLSIAGIGVGSVTNSAPAGMQVGVIALPPS